MAKFDFTLTAGDIGRALDPADGWLTDLAMTAGPTPYEVPCWNEGTRRWVSGYISLRGAGDIRDIVCVDLMSGASFSWLGPTGHLVINGSLPYLGQLMVVCIPRGAVFSLTLSDQPNLRSQSSSMSGWPLDRQRERELVAR